MPRYLLAFIALSALACSADGPSRTVEADHSASSAPAPPAALSAPPVADAPASAAPTADTRNACVMLYECGCNASCVTIDRPRSALEDGLPVNVLSGSLKGTKAFVAKKKTETGGDVFTVQRDDPSTPGVRACDAGAAKALVGYLCATKDSGPPRACASCPE